MNNPRISVKELNLIKGAIRRVFSRSELRREAVKKAIVSHSDPKRKRVKTWCKCPDCGKFEAISGMQVDHIIPLIEVSKTLTDYTWDDIVNRLWCDPQNLVAKCISCHKFKSLEENRQRRAHKKGDKNERKSNKKVKK